MEYREDPDGRVIIPCGVAERDGGHMQSTAQRIATEELRGFSAAFDRLRDGRGIRSILIGSDARFQPAGDRDRVPGSVVNRGARNALAVL